MAQVLFLLTIAAILGAVVLVRSAAKSNALKVLRLARLSAIVAIGVVLGVLALRGNLSAALMIAPALLPLLMRWQLGQRRARAARGPAPGQHSAVETRYLRMHLDHDSGEMRGEVLTGRFKGRQLLELDIDQLIDLWLEVNAYDEQSVAVLEAYLDRVHGDRWQDLAQERATTEGRGRSTPGTGGDMSRDEALEILGLEPGATPEEIKAAHRRLMQRMHPDQGGSTYLAAKINQAKEVLLNI